MRATLRQRAPQGTQRRAGGADAGPPLLGCRQLDGHPQGARQGRRGAAAAGLVVPPERGGRAQRDPAGRRAAGSAGAVVSLIIRNASGDKLDYYLTRTLNYRVLSCSGGKRTVQITATITNHAPASGLPTYVTTRSDGRAAPVGQDRVTASIYVAKGAKLKVERFNGRQANVFLATERGRPVYQLSYELPIGKPQVFQVTVEEPASTAPLSYLVQPLAKPEVLTTQNYCK